MRKLYTPKRIIVLLVFLSSVFIFKRAVSDSSGPSPGYTGAPSESNCTSCHSGTLNNGAYLNRMQIITNMPNGRYSINTTYQITVRIVTANCVRFGFQTIALTPTNVMAGSFGVTNSIRTQKLTSGSKQYMEHTSAGTSNLYTDSTEWTFNWTSPTSNVGNVTFYLAGNVTNNSGTFNNDTIYTKTFSFPPYTPPLGAIGANPANICENDSIKFTGSGTNSPTGWSWTFPGGIPSTSTSQVQYVKFPNAGTPLCSLYVTNASGTSPLVTKSVTVNAYPTASITSTGSTTFCGGDSTLLTGNSGAGYSYLWYLDGISTGLTTSSIYAKTGGNYTLKVTNAGVCSVTSSPQAITVNPKPVPLLTATGPTIFCSGDSVLIRLSGSANTTKEWYNGVTLMTGITDTFIYAKAAGAYSVKLTTPSSCTATSNTINVTVNLYPTASFTSTPSGCLFNLTANSGNNLRYQWFRNDTALVNDTNINYTINSNGTYKVRVTNSSGCGLFSNSQTVNITNLPNVALTVSGNTTFCVGDSVVFSVPQNASYSYKWFKNNNALPNDTLRTITVKDSGTYLVKVSSLTCTNISNATLVKVLAFPDTTIITNNTSFCEGDSGLISAKTGAGFVYKWYRNDTLITGEISSTLKVKNAAKYNVNISNGYCNINGGKVNITVFPIPAIPVITRNGHTLSSTTAASYQWYKDGNLLNGSTSQTYAANSNAGKYKVSIIDANGCKNTSAEFDYSLAGITAIDNSYIIKVYPVPAKESVNIETSIQGTYHLQIFDGCGKKVFDDQITESKTTLDISSWSKGIYMICISEEGNSRVVKFVIE